MDTAFYARSVTPNLSGAISQFQVPFPFLDRSHVAFFLIPPGQTLDTSTQLLTKGVTWVSDGLVTVLPAPTGTLVMQRQTPQAGLIARFLGGTISSVLLTRVQTQLLYVAQEAADTNLSTQQRALLVPDGELGAVLPSFSKRLGQLLLLGTTASGAFALLPTDNLRGPPGTTAELIGPLQAVPGMNLGNKFSAFTTTGYTRAGDGGRGHYARVAKEPTHPGKVRVADRLLPDLVTVDAANGGWFELTDTIVSPEVFGASLDKQDNVSAFQATMDYLWYGRGGGICNPRPGSYNVNGFFRMRPNCGILGAGSDVTRFRQKAESPLTIRHGFEGLGGGSVSFVGFGVDGRGTPNDLPSFADEKAINVGRSDDSSGPEGVEDAFLEDVEISYSRGMGIGIQGKVVTVRKVKVDHCFRDGINLSGSRKVEVSGCSLSKIGDDAIAVHVVRGTAGVTDVEVRIHGNNIEKALGVKVLGGRNTIIANNTFRLCAAYSISVDQDPSAVSGEGLGAKFAVGIIGNTIIDPLGAFQLGKAGLSTAINLGGYARMGTNPAYSRYEGSYTAEGPRIITPEYAYINWSDSEKPVPANRSITVAGNTIVCTLPAAAKFSDLGLGTLWRIEGGEYDPANFAGTIRKVRGIALAGDFRNVLMTGNTIDGVDTPFFITSQNILDDISILGNRTTRFTSFLAIDCPALMHGKVTVDDNGIDCDPYCELPGRNVAEGTWTDFSGVFGAAAFVNNFQGVSMRRNRLSNLRQPLQGSDASRVEFFNNDLFWDWATANTRRGIGYPDDNIFGNNHYFRYSRPIDPAYGQFSRTPDSAFVKDSAAQPSSGYYVEGQFVASRSVALTAGKRTAGWRRLTRGNAHVAGTDWLTVSEAA